MADQFAHINVTNMRYPSMAKHLQYSWQEQTPAKIEKRFLEPFVTKQGDSHLSLEWMKAIRYTNKWWKQSKNKTTPLKVLGESDVVLLGISYWRPKRRNHRSFIVRSASIAEKKFEYFF